MNTRARTGLLLALVAAVISGVSVFLNSYGVKSFGNASLYTTAKNLVAGGVLVLVVAAAAPRTHLLTRPHGWRQLTGLAVVAVVGGTVPFILFFEGLARSASPTQAAFLQKGLVVWVSLMAVPLLRERLRPAHVAAIGLLLVGQASLVGGVDAMLHLRADEGALLVLVATLMWAVEVVVAKPLLGALSSWTVAVARMAVGSMLLLAWAAVQGDVGRLVQLSAAHWGWVLGTGVILAGYVATWFAALSRAGAIDVTAVLVVGAVITAALSAVVNGASIAPAGVVMVLAGVAVVAATMRRPAELRT